MYDLKKQVAIVTGAGSGIGKAIAWRLSKEGAIIVAVDINQESAKELIKEIKNSGGEGLAVKTDVANFSHVQSMVNETLANFNQIDILVNNAGTGSAGRVIDYSEEDWDKPLQVNLKGTFLCSQAVAKQMIPRRKGKIVNIASVAGKSGEEFIGAYCASKFGVIGLTQVLAKELGRYNINVNAICPGYVWTPMWAELARWFKEHFSALAERSLYEIFTKRVEAVTPLRRAQTPEDIANLTAFLVSEEARNITGQAINVDGGAVMH
ncbi:MAG: SDR family NAD(P)-dependent oxidoreductase [Thermodesulfobacteriota bacterium]